jgi:hypothetical protein
MKKILFLVLLALPVKAKAQSSYTGSLDAQSFKTLATSTAACTSTVAVVLSTNTARVGNLICNEDASVSVRVGPSTINANVGTLLTAGKCITYDLPRYFRGSVWCVSTGATVKINAIEGTP